jgi:hypothetical protein
MTTIDDTRAAFRQWLYLPDTGALDAVLGAVAANRLEGDPVWLLLVGPPGGGKSEILNAISGLQDAHPAGTLTEASLLSGTPKRDHEDAAKGGLLRAIGDFGIIVAKDFGSVLSMNRDARAQLLAALREVYDTAWTRHVGTDGGRTLHWNGKVGMIGGVTPTIDRHHAVMGAMGERFVLYRLPEVDPSVQARQALKHAGKERQMRKQLAAAVAELFDASERQPQGLTDDEVTRLVSLATLVVRARSAVERDSYSREIELVPGPEAPTRIITVLDRMLAGLDVIGVTRDGHQARARQRPSPPPRRHLLAHGRTEGHEPGRHRRPTPRPDHPPSPRGSRRARPRRARTAERRKSAPLAAQQIHRGPPRRLSRNVRTPADGHSDQPKRRRTYPHQLHHEQNGKALRKQRYAGLSRNVTPKRGLSRNVST